MNKNNAEQTMPSVAWTELPAMIKELEIVQNIITEARDAKIISDKCWLLVHSRNKKVIEDIQKLLETYS